MTNKITKISAILTIGFVTAIGSASFARSTTMTVSCKDGRKLQVVNNLFSALAASSSSLPEAVSIQLKSCNVSTITHESGTVQKNVTAEIYLGKLPKIANPGDITAGIEAARKNISSVNTIKPISTAKKITVTDGEQQSDIQADVDSKVNVLKSDAKI